MKQQVEVLLLYSFSGQWEKGLDMSPGPNGRALDTQTSFRLEPFRLSGRTSDCSSHLAGWTHEVDKQTEVR
jgi:hypothetical protein